MRTKTALAVAALAVATITAPSARAAEDQSVALLTSSTGIAAGYGAVVWSVFDTKAQRYRLTVRFKGRTGPAAIPSSRRSFDASVGRNERGRVVVLYTRCTNVAKDAATGCDVYRYDVAARHERKLRSVSAPAVDEAWPAQDGKLVAFARRLETRVGDTYDETFDRPTPEGQGSGSRSACDATYVQDVTTGGPSRRLDRGLCASITGLSISGDTIVYTGNELESSSARVVSAHGGPVRILDRNGWGEGGAAYLTSPIVAGRYAYMTRSGNRQDTRNGLLRINLRTGAGGVREPGDGVTAAIARDRDGSTWYVRTRPPNSEERFTGAVDCSAEEPCQLVRAGADPFANVARTLLPVITVGALDDAAELRSTGTTATFSGTIEQKTVRGGKVISSAPVAHAPVHVVAAPWLVRNRTQPSSGTCPATSIDLTTDGEGRWTFTVTDIPAGQEYCTYAISSPALGLSYPKVYLSGAA